MARSTGGKFGVSMNIGASGSSVSSTRHSPTREKGMHDTTFNGRLGRFLILDEICIKRSSWPLKKILYFLQFSGDNSKWRGLTQV